MNSLSKSPITKASSRDLAHGFANQSKKPLAWLLLGRFSDPRGSRVHDEFSPRALSLPLYTELSRQASSYLRWLTSGESPHTGAAENDQAKMTGV